MQSQSHLRNALEEIKDTESVIMCFRCQRPIKAVDRDNELSSAIKAGNHPRQLNLF